ncbi:hypothetical protein [Catenulispora subtropica]|uniref:NHL repeat containing protein n=1 Tax=Catenulispora subtropica TaxID=450798 RepID=A0ABP5E309_9ACTN
MRPTEHRVLHYDLSHLGHPEREYTFRHGAHRLPLKRHTAHTRAEARAADPVLRLIPDRHLTHFVAADLYTDAIGINAVSVKKRVGGELVDRVVHMAVHIPAEGRRRGSARYWRHRVEVARKRGVELPRTVHPKLARHGVTWEQCEEVLGSADGGDGIPTFPKHVDNFYTALDAAVTLLYHHQNLINLDTTDGGSTPQYLVDCITTACLATDDLVLEIQSEGDDWLVTTPIAGSPGADSTVPSATVQALTTGPLQQVLADTQNDTELENVVWRPRYGFTSSTYNATDDGPPPNAQQPDSGEHIPRGSFELGAGAAAGNWSAKNLTPSNGLSIDSSSIRYTAPPATTTWTGTGLWSINDAIPLPYAGTGTDPGDLPDRIAQGQLSIVISSQKYPNGFLTGVLVPNGTDPDTCQALYSVTFAPTAPGIVTPAVAAASCSLNTGVSGLSYDISVALDGEAGPIAAGFQYPDPNGGKTPGTAPLQMSDATGYGTLSIECTNNWLRHLSACVQYIGDDGGVLDPPDDWVDQIPEFLRGAFEPDPQTKFVKLVQPVATVFGVPIPDKPVRISVPVWDEVATVRFLWGGLGTGAYNAAVAPIGLTMTCMAELALPVFLMWATAAVMNSNTVKSIMADTDVLLATCAAGSFLVAGPTAAYIATAQDPGAAASGLAEKFGPMFLDPATSLGKWVYKQVAEAEIEQAIPFIDTALDVLNAAVTAAQLAQTTVEVLQSPFCYETDLSRSVELDVTLKPDPSVNIFPEYHDHYTVTVTYDTGATAAVVTDYLPPQTLSDPITVTFPAIPSGGDIKVVVAFYSDDNWQSGQGNSDWVDTVVDSGRLAFDVYVQTNEVPLGATSVYAHDEKIVLLTDGSNQLGWQAMPGKPPTATLTTPPPYSSKGMVVQYLAGITVAQSPEMIGYCWQATGLNLPPDTPDQPPQNYAMWTLQNLSVMQHPSQGLSYPKVGFTGQPLIDYDLASADDGTGPNFFLDPTRGTFDPDTNPGGGLHLRRLALTHASAPEFDVGNNQSYGRFPLPMDRCMLHPQGFMVGVNNATHKIFILNVLDQPVTDDTAPMATQAAGQGDRDGLVYEPVAICTALDGRVLVLEAGNQRVQAFDTFGNPVNYFKNPDYDPDDPDSTETIPTMALVSRPSTTLQDLAVESKGFIYVLSYTGDGSSPKQYWVDLFNPDGTLLVSTQNVTAARFTVDLLRSLYTLNYETIVDADYRVQPSVSKWLPPAPAGPPPSAVEGSHHSRHHHEAER